MSEKSTEYQSISAAACADGDVLISQPDPETKSVLHMVISEGQVSRFVDELITASESIRDMRAANSEAI